MLASRPDGKLVSIPETREEAQVALHAYVRARLFWAATVAKDDLNPHFSLFPEGITNPLVLRHITNHVDVSQFTPAMGAIQQLTLMLDDVLFQPTSLEPAQPLDILSGKVAEQAVMRVAAEVIWELAIRHRRLTEWDYWRLQQAGRHLGWLARRQGDKSHLWQLNQHIWVWHLATAWVVMLSNIHGFNLMSELEHLFINPAAPTGRHVVIE